MLFLPDCNSYLCEASVLLFNDDEWLSVRASANLKGAGLSLLHPSISLLAASLLGVQKISNVLVEKLDLPVRTFQWDDFDGDTVKQGMRLIIQGISEVVQLYSGNLFLSKILHSCFVVVISFIEGSGTIAPNDLPGCVGEEALVQRISRALVSGERQSCVCVCVCVCVCMHIRMCGRAL